MTLYEYFIVFLYIVESIGREKYFVRDAYINHIINFKK